MDIKSFFRPFTIVNDIISGQCAEVYNKLAYDQRVAELRQYALTSKESGISSEKYCEEEIIVSLTTYEKRLHDVYLTIESIMQGSMKPNRIVLWLADELKNIPLPRVLQLQERRGLEIRYCEEIRSFKKLVPSLQAFPNASIVTIDDDAFYSYDMLEILVNAHIQKPRSIVSHWISRISVDDNFMPTPCKLWQNFVEKNDDSCLNSIVGVGGVLYPPNSLDKEVLNKDSFMKLCPYADDFWFYCMAIKAGTKMNCAPSHYHGNPDLMLNRKVQDTSLLSINMSKTSPITNDTQMAALFHHYHLSSFIREELGKVH